MKTKAKSITDIKPGQEPSQPKCRRTTWARNPQADCYYDRTGELPFH